MNARKIGLTQAKAAYIAEISERTGQRIEAGTHQPNRGKVTNRSNTQDPLGEVWEKELEPMLKKEPRLKPMTLFEYLQDTYRAQISPSTANAPTTSANVESIAWIFSRSNV